MISCFSLDYHDKVFKTSNLLLMFGVKTLLDNWLLDNFSECFIVLLRFLNKKENASLRTHVDSERLNNSWTQKAIELIAQ